MSEPRCQALIGERDRERPCGLIARFERDGHPVCNFHLDTKWKLRWPRPRP